MELKIRKQEAHYLEIELVGEDIAFAESIKEILIENKDVEFASATLEHPQVASPLIVLRTKSKNALELLADAVDQLKESADEFKAALKTAKKK
ncbi:MAG: RpoL/Rpb11 RNA polymerase subunit family protein [Candidatus Micrarchaeia archaeon]